MEKRMFKRASKIAKELFYNKPTTTFLSLRESADAMEYGSGEQKLAYAVVAVLEKNRAESMEERSKLMADLDRLGLSRLAMMSPLENMSHEIAEAHNCIAHENEFTRHLFAIVAHYAEEECIDINAKLGYVIH